MSPVLYKTIVVDDEPPALERLNKLLGNFPKTFDVIGKAVNGNQGVQLIDELKPDLIFLDIEMPGMSGFEMLANLKKIPIVVFCTAYDQYSLQAFETNSIDYLLKPVKIERLKQTVSKLELFGMKSQPEKILDFLKQISTREVEKEMTSIAIKNKDCISFIKLIDVAYFKAEDKYVSLYLQNGEEKITDQTLLQLNAKLPDYFLQVHRSIIVNFNRVVEVQTYFNSRFSIQLNDIYKSKIVSGRSFHSAIKKWMGI